MTQLTLDAAEGQRLQRQGQETVAAKNAEFLELMRWAAKTISRFEGHVTTDDLRRLATGHGPYPTHHNAWGCIFKQKGWTVIGRQPSKLPSNHAREIRVYRWDGNSQ